MRRAHMDERLPCGHDRYRGALPCVCVRVRFLSSHREQPQPLRALSVTAKPCVTTASTISLQKVRVSCIGAFATRRQCCAP